MGEYDRNQGTWAWDGDVLVMKPEKENRTDGFRGMALRYVPVTWGKRVYLVEETGMPGFCAGMVYKPERIRPMDMHGVDYVKCERGELPPVEGSPHLPERYQDFATRGEILATLVSHAGDRGVLKEQGRPRLKVGMRLCRNSWGDAPTVVVTAIQGHEARVKVMSSSDSKQLTAGTIFTTGNYWHR